MAQELTTNDVATLEWWTVRELAKRWRVSEDTVLRMIKREDLAARKFGDQWRVHNSVVVAYEQGGKPQRKAPPPARPAAVIDGSDPWGVYSSSPSPARNR